MRITKVYTRTGDKGHTSLVGGEKVPKNNIRIESYGTVDELNAIIGLIRTFNKPTPEIAEASARLDTMLHSIQNDLFDVGADLATAPHSRWEGMHRISEVETKRLESWIDELNKDLPPLKEFILPGGGPVGAFFHQARTVCRRAERVIVTLINEEPEVELFIMQYLNRLSDWLFVAGRWAAKMLGEKEFFWERNR